MIVFSTPKSDYIGTESFEVMIQPGNVAVDTSRFTFEYKPDPIPSSIEPYRTFIK